MLAQPARRLLLLLAVLLLAGDANGGGGRSRAGTTPDASAVAARAGRQAGLKDGLVEEWLGEQLSPWRGVSSTEG